MILRCASQIDSLYLVSFSRKTYQLSNMNDICQMLAMADIYSNDMPLEIN